MDLKILHLMRMAFMRNEKPSMVGFVWMAKAIDPEWNLKRWKGWFNILKHSVPLGYQTWIEMGGDHIYVMSLDGHKKYLGRYIETNRQLSFVRSDFMGECSSEARGEHLEAITILSRRFWRGLKVTL